MFALTNNFANAMDLLRDDEIVCIDETGFCNVGNSVYGYFPKGRDPDAVLLKKREKLSCIMAIHPVHGVVSYATQKDAYNTQTFLEFLRDHPGVALREEETQEEKRRLFDLYRPTSSAS